MNYYFIKLHLFGILLISLWACKSKTLPVRECDKLWINSYDSSYNTDTFYTNVLKDISFNYQFQHADSILHKKIVKAKVLPDHDALKSAFTIFFSLPELSDQSSYTSKYEADALEELSEDGEPIADWNLNYALFRYYLSKADSKKSIELASKLQERAQNLAIPECSALASLALGEANDLNGNYKFAISNLFNAHSQIANSSRSDIKRHILSGISKFYQDHYMYENALTYKIKELDLWQPKNRLDTIQYYHDQLGYQDIMAASDEERNFNAEQVHKIIEFAKIHRCKKLYIFATAFLRTTLINSDNKKELNQYFRSLETEEILQIKANSPFIFYLLSAFDLESKKQIDPAMEMYKNALQEVEKTNSDDRKSYFYLQYAQFLDRNGKTDEAGRQFEQAIQYAKIAQNQEFEMKASLAADAFYARHQIPEKAYRHIKNYYRLLNVKSAISRDQDVYKMQIMTEQKILENKKLLDESYQERYNQVQYNLIAIFIFAVFLLLLTSVRFNVPIWFIRVVGYIGVIFAFEFCIIQIDHYIHEVTHYTPWKIFTIKVIVISIILPVHHLIEKKLIKFLIERRQSKAHLLSVYASQLTNWFKKLDSPNDPHGE